MANSVAATLTISVTAKPVISSIVDTTATVGTQKVITPINTGGAVIIWSATGLSDGATIDPISGQIHWVPTLETTLNITITATNAAGSDDEAVAIVSSNPVTNTAPEIRLSGASGINAGGDFTEGNGYTAYLTAATLTDSDDTDIDSMTMTCGGSWGADGPDEMLKFDAWVTDSDTNLTDTLVVGSTTFELAFVASTGVLTIVKSGGGAFPKADGQALIRLQQYGNVAEPPTEGDRTFTWIANDGTDDSAPAVLIVSVTAAPVAATDIYTVRRTSDDSTLGVDLTEVEDGTLATFVGAGDGAVETWHDDSGNGNAVTMATTTNQPKVALSGTVQEGVVFQGTDFLSRTRITSGVVSQLSVALWMKMADLGITRTIACEMTTANSWRLNVKDNGALSLFRYNGAATGIVDSDAVDLDDGTWKHIVVICNGSNVKFYVDNVLDTEETADVVDSSVSGSTVFELGADRNYSTFNGSMSDFRVFQSVLSEADVEAVYNGEDVGSPLLHLRGTYETAPPPPPSGEPTYHDNDDLTGWPNWESRMLTWGAHWGDEILAHTDDPDYSLALNTGYYDYTFVAYSIAEYTNANHALWRSRGDAWMNAYSRFLDDASGVTSGYMQFSGGFRKVYETTGSLAARELVRAVAEDGAFSRDTTPFTPWVYYADYSRENAYSLMNKCDAFKCGFALSARTDTLVAALFADGGHIDQWFDNDPYVSELFGVQYFAPFMFGLTCLAGIQYINDINPSSPTRTMITDQIARGATWVRANAWVEEEQQHWYRQNEYLFEYAPDLEMYLAPVYWWLWLQTGTSTWKTYGDASFNAAFATTGGSAVGIGKQFNQSYRWAFDGLLYRAQGNAAWG